MMAKDRSRTRNIVNAGLRREDLDEALAAYEKIGKELKVIAYTLSRSFFRAYRIGKISYPRDRKNASGARFSGSINASNILSPCSRKTRSHARTSRAAIDRRR